MADEIVEIEVSGDTAYRLRIMAALKGIPEENMVQEVVDEFIDNHFVVPGLA